MAVALDPAVEIYSQMFERSTNFYVTNNALSFDEAFKRVREEATPLAVGAPDQSARVEAGLEDAWRRITEQRERVRYYTKCALQSGRVAWYNGPADGADEWGKLVGRLGRLGRSEDTINQVDEESTTILNLIDNPAQQKFSTRGLVVGYVQSGKTGNMAALLAKAAATPFKFFVVLSGMTDSLRNQTQKRLDSDIVSMAATGRWHRETRADVMRADGVVERGDFTIPAGGSFQLGGDSRHLAVMKKNAGVLRRFLRTLNNTPESMLRETPFLIIDDECDQASINSAAYDHAITAINKLIRDILAKLPRAAYVGYTATPYANVLINTQAEDDLYPRHFIHALKKPENYFGTEELFGRAALDGDASMEELEGFSMIRTVEIDEIGHLRPLNKNHDFKFEVTPSLAKAVQYFVMCIAAKEKRGLGEDHATMLVHTSMLTRIHELARSEVAPFLRGLANQLRAKDRVVIAEMERLWEHECAEVSAREFGGEPISFKQILPRLAGAAASIEVKVENWSSTDRIDYDVSGRKYLVIGGNVLARGLTLEGLVVSLFMRTSSQYDTLMQMGRWFGYRRGFEELPRIWMEDPVREAFFQLASVEEEIRRDIGKYALENLTPSQFAVRIRQIPGMLITNRNRLRHAVMAKVGYAGEHLQTLRFPRRDKTLLEANWKAGENLLRRSRRLDGDRYVFEAGFEEILAFLGEYQVYGGSSKLQPDQLTQYIRQTAAEDNQMRRWRVVVVTTEDGVLSEKTLHPIGQVHTNSRSAMQGGGGDAFIKALMSKRDLLLDMDVQPTVPAGASWDDIKGMRSGDSPPLLLLYPINRQSKPKPTSRKSDREALNAVVDILGFGVYLPGDPERSHDYVQANLQPADVVDDEAIDDITLELLEE